MNSFIVQLVCIECCNCGCQFGMTTEMNQRFLDDSNQWFRCPNGHKQHYTGPNREQVLKEKLADAQACCARASKNIDYLHRVAAANKGVVTRMKNKERKLHEQDLDVTELSPSLPV